MKTLARREREERLSGADLRALRDRCGYSAREFAEFLSKEGEPITSKRSVYRLEMKQRVPLRYLDAFKRFVGPLRYEQCLNALIEQEAASPIQESATGGRGSDARKAGGDKGMKSREEDAGGNGEAQ